MNIEWDALETNPGGDQAWNQFNLKYAFDILEVTGKKITLRSATVGPGSSDPLYIPSKLLYKMGYYLVDILYIYCVLCH